MATKKKELLEQDAPVTETVMSEDETLLADTAQPESLPAAAGDGADGPPGLRRTPVTPAKSGSGLRCAGRGA